MFRRLTKYNKWAWSRRLGFPGFRPAQTLDAIPPPNPPVYGPAQGLMFHQLPQKQPERRGRRTCRFFEGRGGFEREGSGPDFHRFAQDGRVTTEDLYLRGKNPPPKGLLQGPRRQGRGWVGVPKGLSKGRPFHMTGWRVGAFRVGGAPCSRGPCQVEGRTTDSGIFTQSRLAAKAALDEY